MQKMAAELGVEAPKARRVFVSPPKNVWRHFREMQAKYLSIPANHTQWYVLECLKAIYGLVDAPLLWQMALTHYLKHALAGMSSSFDENCIFWSTCATITLVVTIHVDDLLVAGLPLCWLH